MKKGRPGFVLNAICEKDRLHDVASLMLSATTTGGVRVQEFARLKLKREVVKVQTRFGEIRIKVFDYGDGKKFAPEYEDCLEAARRAGVPVRVVIEEANYAMRKTDDARS